MDEFEGRKKIQLMFSSDWFVVMMRMRMRMKMRMKMKMMLLYLCSQRMWGGLVRGEEGTGQLRLVGEGGGTWGGEVSSDPRSPRTTEV